MRLLFKQRFFSWFDSYDIYDESGAVLFTVEGKLSWGHCLHHPGLRRTAYRHRAGAGADLPAPVRAVRLRGLSGVPEKEFTLFTPRFVFDCSDWQVEGSWTEWDYAITSPSQGLVAAIGKELFNWTDTYVIDVEDQSNALCALMVVLAIDAEKCGKG